MLPTSKTIITAETFSAPTAVSIRFLNPAPVEKPQPIIKQETPKPVVKKKIAKKIIPQQLNKIEPAAAPIVEELPTPEPTKIVEVKTVMPKSIPVTSKVNLKGRRIQPEYPKRALRLKQEGVVWIHVLVSETGSREDIKLYRPSQYALLNQAALKAVKRWTFNPNMINGQPRKSWVEIPIEFKIQ